MKEVASVDLVTEEKVDETGEETEDSAEGRVCGGWPSRCIG